MRTGRASIFPPLARVRQSIPQPRLDDVPGTVRRLIQTSRLRERVRRAELLPWESAVVGFTESPGLPARSSTRCTR